MTMTKQPRNNCKDIWNAHMVKGAKFSRHDIPICPTMNYNLPNELISYTKARAIYKKMLKTGHKKFYINAYIHFYLDDFNFDNHLGVWNKPYKLRFLLKHFAGCITPDFSTYGDFPLPIKLYNFYRMRAFDFWLANHGISLIHNVRWGTEETFAYCFDGIPKESIIAIGTVASELGTRIGRKVFCQGFQQMIKVLEPQQIIIYGGAAELPLKKIAGNIPLHFFQGDTAQHFENWRSNHE